MDGTSSPRTLAAWSLGTFHATTFMVVVAVAEHVSGGLRNALARLDTATGIAAFLVLWALTFGTTRAGLRRIGSDGDATASTVVMRLTVAGGWNGAAIFSVLLAGALFSLAMRSTATPAIGPLLFLSVTLGGLLAFTIGAIVGCVYGLIDVVLLWCGDALLRWAIR